MGPLTWGIEWWVVVVYVYDEEIVPWPWQTGQVKKSAWLKPLVLKIGRSSKVYVLQYCRLLRTFFPLITQLIFLLLSMYFINQKIKASKNGSGIIMSATILSKEKDVGQEWRIWPFKSAVIIRKIIDKAVPAIILLEVSNESATGRELTSSIESDAIRSICRLSLYLLMFKIICLCIFSGFFDNSLYCSLIFDIYLKP